jgi:hypothetical protein
LIAVILAVPKTVTGGPGADQIEQQKEFVEAYDQYVRALLIGEKVSYVGKGKMEVVTNLVDKECTNSLLMNSMIKTYRKFGFHTLILKDSYTGKTEVHKF